MPDLSVVDRLQDLLGRVIAVVFLAVAAAIAYEVVARYLLNAPTIWAHELTATLVAVAFLFGGPYAMVRGEHIRITSLYMHFPPRLRLMADIVAALVTLFYIGAMIYAAWIVAGRAWSRMETSASAWNQPTPVVIKTALVVASALIAVQTLLQLARHLGLVRPAPAPTD
ncbi:hypothetical protein LNKW23_38000 [Paralimibaculum aggregatum]|uniref:TRAP transporter small permease protein n=1 Tax=Paralimibaculum aggregatum TaxID=3036245 RepID=A0ABQ6LRZ6_9RHOB|nr:TRAP transporter small permease [Limibaculum sp. NKW23]GMG84584.1 hypothetical protein LNKW23_38000 [Limibaculum sp. NKW23]